MNVIKMDGEKVSEYMQIMYNHLDDFETIIKEMEAIENNVIWDSPAGRVGIASYKKLIKDYIVFSNKLMPFIDYLKGYVNGYDELVAEVKEKYKALNEKYEIGEDLYGKIIK